MGSLANEIDRDKEASLALHTLLSTARSIAEDKRGWSSPELRKGFLSRLRTGEDPLGERYSAILSGKKRRAIGAVLTPPRIVRAMIDWSRNEARVSGAPLRIVDAGAGTGRFAMAAAEAFPSAAIIAVENDPKLLVLLRANLREAGLARQVSVSRTISDP